MRYVYKNNKTNKYLSFIKVPNKVVPEMYESDDIFNAKLYNINLMSYTIIDDVIYNRVSYEQELRKIKLQKLQKNTNDIVN